MSTEQNFSRREMIRRGLFGAVGLFLADRLCSPVLAVAPSAKAKAVIQIWMWGGPSHLDTFDPKPDAGYDYCGPLNKPIPTNVNGIIIGELLPLLAKQADKYSIIRSMTHGVNSHETASYIVQTGRMPGDGQVYPCVGAVVALFKGYPRLSGDKLAPAEAGAGYSGLIPPYIVLTDLQGRFSEAGFLGSRYKPFATGGDPAKTPFVVEGVVAQGITEQRQRSRRELLHNLNTLGQTLKNNPQLAALEQCEKQAYDLILGDAGKVFDLADEKKELREQYGLNTFGQSCLVARRLVERGVPYITINYKGWDTHKEHFQAMRRKLPEMDKGMATLLQDLSDRNLLESTIVWWSGEFGRTPKVQWEAPWNGGRNHYGKVFSAVVAGGGFKGGCVVGASDAKGEEVKERPVYPVDLIASMYELLGIDPDGTLPHPQGLTVRVTPSAADGVKMGGRLKEIMSGQAQRDKVAKAQSSSVPLCLCAFLSVLCALRVPIAPEALAAMPAARAQRDPRIGYVYPAGGKQGTTFQVAIGGQYLDGVSGVDICGGGVQATVIEHVKPLTGKEINLLRDRLKELQQMMNPTKPDKWESDTGGGANATASPDPNMDQATLQKEMAEIKKKLANPKNRNRDNPQLSEDVTLKVSLAPDAEPGQRELRLKTASGLSNPLVFHIGQLPEYTEKEPNSKTADTEVLSLLPLVINGQILPGDVDRFRLKLSKGTRLVVAARAQELIPYLADAVPGWFQATLTLYDAKSTGHLTVGNELAYDDDYRFHPDPVLFYEIPQDDEYVLEIKDAIYRGREDFVYRITVGELPFVTSIFPLGGPAGATTTVQMKGWNLPASELTLDAKDKPSGIIPVSVQKLALSGAEGEGLISNAVPFAVNTLPECLEQEPDNQQKEAQPVILPIIVNGRIDQPGDVDIFRFEGHAGDKIIAEVYARRLDSPLDSVLKLTPAFAGAGPAPAQAGATGRQLAFNDDHEDKGAGLTTHQADSLLSITLPADGTYYLTLGDAQHKGGPAYGYRLRISPPQPDFELRVVPSSVNVRAGATAALTVYALRKDGFSDEIILALKDAPSGFKLTGGKVPAGQDQAKVTLKAPPTPTPAPRLGGDKFTPAKAGAGAGPAPAQAGEPISLHLEGRAVIHGQEIVRLAVPADDMMQAFFYRHLVPAKDLKVAVIPRAKPNPAKKKATESTESTEIKK